MLDAKGVSTPLSTSEALSLNDGASPTDAKEYRQIIGALQYPECHILRCQTVGSVHASSFC